MLTFGQTRVQLRWCIRKDAGAETEGCYSPRGAWRHAQTSKGMRCGCACWPWRVVVGNGDGRWFWCWLDSYDRKNNGWVESGCYQVGAGLARSIGGGRVLRWDDSALDRFGNGDDEVWFVCRGCRQGGPRGGEALARCVAFKCARCNAESRSVWNWAVTRPKSD